MQAPELLTERLLLRGHRREDLSDCLAMWSDPRVVRFIGGRPFSEEEVWARLHRDVGHWALVGYGYWLVAERASGCFLGEVGFADFKRAITPSFEGAPEAGWAFARKAQGHGYATEALLAATGWLDQHIGKQRRVCMIEEENVTSIRVARKAVFRDWTHTTYKGTPIRLLEQPPGASRLAGDPP